MFRSAPVALRCTRMSLERANLVRGTRAPDFAIFVLLSSSRGRSSSDGRAAAEEAMYLPCVARLVTQPTALH